MKNRELVAVPLVATQSFESKLKERRRYQRVGLTLSGRYMLRDHHEYPCRAINISPGGIGILGMKKGLIGERVVAYFDQIGRIEGMIARNFDNCFAVTMQLSAPKCEKLTQVLCWLVSRHTRGVPDNRVHERIRLYRRRMTLTTMDGRQYQAGLIDASILGAALAIDTVPSVGSPVIIGRTSARVVRHFATGIAVKFDELLPTETFNEDTRL
jgi:PilZ domain